MIQCPACAAPALDIDVRCAACAEPFTTDEARLRIGSVVLDSYAVVDILGQGGMSVVYRARHRMTDQEVALKILPPELAANAQVKSRFLEEARALAQLDHPNIVHLYNFGHDDGCLVLAMQLVGGQTWERMILTEGRLSWPASVAIAIDVLKALETAHARGIIHRDMKPSNVLVRPDGSALVTDFGIAKMTTSTRLTATGQTMGTVRYMSPEQVRGQEVDPRTDIYSLCVTLYESMCGSTPFDGESHFEIMAAHLTKDPPTLSAQGSALPPVLEGLVMSGLAKQPDDRPASARALRSALEDLLAKAPALTATGPIGGPVAAPVRKRRPIRPGRPLVWLLLGALALGAGGVAALLVSGRDRDGRPAQAPPERARPDPYLMPGLEFAVDRRFDADRLRVLSVAPRDAEEVRRVAVRAQRDFAASLRARGVSAHVEAQPLTIVMVPQARMCDGRVYERGQAPADCESRTFWYRPLDRTLYLADEPGFAPHLAFAVAGGMCLHSRAEGCEQATVDFGEAELERAQGK
jgi:tRNA A-37 threonylcarbamoyl transferase component Bud32